MLLSASEISEEIGRGRIAIQPFTPALLRRATYTLRLANSWMRWKRSEEPIKMWSQNASQKHLEPIESAPTIILRSGDLVLASTMEAITIPNDLMGILCGLSHVARFGLTVTGGSMFIRPGFGVSEPKTLTLELASFNPAPLELEAGMPICHLAFMRLTSFMRESGKSIYENIHAPCPPLLYEDMATVIASFETRQH